LGILRVMRALEWRHAGCFSAQSTARGAHADQERRFIVKIRSLLGLAMLFCLSASGCVTSVGEGNDEDSVGSTSAALTNDGVYMGDYSGRMYRSAGAIPFDSVSSENIFNAMRDSTWPTSAPKAYHVIDWADWENYAEDMNKYGNPAEHGLCGEEARQHYNAASGAKWCTEYARWVLRQGGLKDIRYCKTSFIGCLDYVYLKEARTVNDMVQLFTANGGWIDRARLTPDAFRPGNYLAMMSHKLHKNHSGIIMSVSSDRRYLYTSEGNVTGDDGKDCVYYQVHDLYVDGVLDSQIDGVGDISVAF